MENNEFCDRVVGAFARACEELNEYKRKLERVGTFVHVECGADVRMYVRGWALEKWIEAVISEEDDWRRAWWLDMQCENGILTVNCNVSYNERNLYQELPVKQARSIEELELALSECLSWLTNALESNLEFKVKNKTFSNS